MFKPALKLLALTLLLTAGFLFVSGGQASALTDNCPGAPYNDWGYTNGSGSLPTAMSSLMVRAVDTSSGNAPLNTRYILNSDDPTSNNPDLDKRIFKWPPGTGGRDNQAPFYTGENLSGERAGEPSSCNGWSVLGPGISGYAGDGYVLDCGASGGEGNVNFWISHVDNPNGAPGRWALFNTTGGIHALITSDVNNDNGAHVFTESNGGNISLRLEWNPAPTQPPSAAGACQSLSITEAAGSTRTRTYVSVSGVTVGRVHYKEGGNEKWWPSQTGPGNLNQTNINTYVGPGSGHDPPDNPDVSGSPAWDGEKNMTVTKDWFYQPSANAITVTYRSDTWNSATSSWNNGATQYLQRNPDNSTSWTATPTSLSCFSATCSVSFVDGDGPGGVVLAGGTMHIHGLYRNTSPPPDNLPIWNPSLSVGGSQNPGNNGVHMLWASPPPAYTGYDYDFDMYLTAPNNVTWENLSLTPVYFNNGAIGGACYAGPVSIYRQFSGSVSASSALKPTIEHPYQGDDYSTSITLQWNGNPPGTPDHNVNIINTHSEFYKLSAGGAKTGIASNTGGTYPASASGSTTNTMAGHYDLPAGSYQAGDEYCAHIHADYTAGYVGPDNNVVNPSAPQDAYSCPRVANEPYFKVYNGDIFAGGEFNQCLDNAHGGGGTLAGYADISDPANPTPGTGPTRGSSSELSALALVKITGVASAQSIVGRNPQNINRPPTNLTFANSGSGVTVDSSGTESPTLGGQYGGCRTLTNATAPATAPALGSGTLTSFSGRNGSYTRSGNLVVNGGTLSAGQNVSIFVDGNIYINGPITYGTGWSAGTAPSLVLHATGSIYIDPGVTKLSGLYIAQKDSRGNGGKIYTCANGFTPMAAKDLYSCNNQLVVYGSFVADQINLMRTFGSLRDEEPNPPTPGVAGEAAPTLSYSSCGKYGKPQGGEPCLSNDPGALGLRCTNINEPSDTDGWGDNILCLPSSSDVHMYWTHWSNSPYSVESAAAAGDPGAANLDNVKAHGYGTCVPFNANDPNTWSDNYLCFDKDFSPTFSPNAVAGKSCTKIVEISDTHDNQWKSGYNLCLSAIAGTVGSPATPKGPPFNNCSNRGTVTDTSGVAGGGGGRPILRLFGRGLIGGGGAKTCAAEVFEYSPELYLTSPAVQPPGGGSIQFQALTSLPPVL